ncbi:unnamed protein product [Dibothriocephalus latus]|uniref:GIY-YIG domain-containing protein n=1 Tax=Dibothriocephalus latus TaxID=60516 RepID=A0A3P7MDD2_DIBLA|nr:unnamed protein product [Dibothriocephalus latus]
MSHKEGQYLVSDKVLRLLQIMKPKDPLSRQETSGVDYRIRCSCGQRHYVGETGRILKTRIAEHEEMSEKLADFSGHEVPNTR